MVVVLAVVTSGCDGSGGIAPNEVETSNHVAAVTATAALLLQIYDYSYYACPSLGHDDLNYPWL